MSVRASNSGLGGGAPDTGELSPRRTRRPRGRLRSICARMEIGDSVEVVPAACVQERQEAGGRLQSKRKDNRDEYAPDDTSYAQSIQHDPFRLTDDVYHQLSVDYLSASACARDCNVTSYLTVCRP